MGKKMNGNTLSLPPHYNMERTIDLAQDKHLNVLIQSCFVLITGILIGLALWTGLPLSSTLNPFLSFFITVVLVLVYMALHETMHAVFIKIFSRSRPAYRIRFPFLSVGSEAYFNRRSFIVIALAPVTIWGAALISLLALVPNPLFLSVYILMIVNFAGSAGDYIQAYIALTSPADTLFQDNGKATALYTPQGNKKDSEIRDP